VRMGLLSKTGQYSVGSSEELRFVTYLSPGIPQALFEAIVDHVRRTLGYDRTSLRVEARISGPEKGGEDPFSGGGADVGFMCAPSFVRLRELRPAPVELLGVAPVFRDERSAGKPVYFCDVIVRRGGQVRAFGDLRGLKWAYNDGCSLSGYYSLLIKLAEMGADERFFGRVFCSGSHLRSIDLVARGEVDAAVIDSNVLRMRLRESPDLRERLRVLESLGPYPIQPVVVRSALHPEVKKNLRASLLATEADARCHRVISGFGLERFVPVTDEDYPPDLLGTIG
jgi:phosphonate transport system substrate-binding protein